MSPQSSPDPAPTFRWWWILPGVAALLGGLSYFLWLQRQKNPIHPVRIDLSFVRSQPFQPEGAPLPAAAEILILEVKEPTVLNPMDESVLPASNGLVP